jgi:hypothetical protein
MIVTLEVCSLAMAPCECHFDISHLLDHRSCPHPETKQLQKTCKPAELTPAQVPATNVPKYLLKAELSPSRFL